MSKGSFKMLVNMLFTSIKEKSVFEQSVDFNEQLSKPDESVFSIDVELPKKELEQNEEG